MLQADELECFFVQIYIGKWIFHFTLIDMQQTPILFHMDVTRWTEFFQTNDEIGLLEFCSTWCTACLIWYTVFYCVVVVKFCVWLSQHDQPPSGQGPCLYVSIIHAERVHESAGGRVTTAQSWMTWYSVLLFRLFSIVLVYFVLDLRVYIYHCADASNSKHGQDCEALGHKQRRPDLYSHRKPQGTTALDMCWREHVWPSLSPNQLRQSPSFLDTHGLPALTSFGHGSLCPGSKSLQGMHMLLEHCLPWTWLEKVAELTIIWTSFPIFSSTPPSFFHDMRPHGCRAILVIPEPGNQNAPMKLRKICAARVKEQVCVQQVLSQFHIP